MQRSAGRTCDTLRGLDGTETPKDSLVALRCSPLDRGRTERASCVDACPAGVVIHGAVLAKRKPIELLLVTGDAFDLSAARASAAGLE